MYQQAVKILRKIFREDQIFKYGFNLSPMYRRSVGRIMEVSKNLHEVKVQIPLSYKNRNFVGSIFGGSLFAASDPIYMIQLLHILGEEYVVWDKSASISYKRPAKEKTYAMFQFSEEEIENIKKQVATDNEIDVVKKLMLTSAAGNVFAEVEKTVYIASKDYYKKKRAARGRK